MDDSFYEFILERRVLLPGSSGKPQNSGKKKAKLQKNSQFHHVGPGTHESGDGKNLSESRDSDTKKGQQIPARKGSQTAVIPRQSPEDKNEKISKESLSVVEKSTKSGSEVS